ncbi:MAG: polysaccharide deacetylase family protein [Cyclobacteriaceae bacterium]
MIYSRRKAIKTLSLGSAGLALPGLVSFNEPTITHILSLSFDDGFKKSFRRTAEIYEKHDFKACFNVLATGHLPSFEEPDEYMLKPLLGDFELWNELKQRGHEVMPHGYKHANLSKISFKKAQSLIQKCLEYFTDHLDGFEAKEAIFNFPFLASTPELETWLPTQVKAFRTYGPTINPFPKKGQARLTCGAAGPDNIDQQLQKQIEDFLAGDGGWFIFNTHGLEEEGWGPISAQFLDNLLTNLKGIQSLAVLPVGEALKLAEV